MGQVKEPGQPDIPEVNGDIDFQTFKYKVRVTLQGKPDSIDEEIILNSDTLSTAGKKNIILKDISKINVLMWEKRGNSNKCKFFPVRYEILFRDNNKIIINGNIKSLNRIKISKKKTGYIYLYYYDYLKNGKWVNSGVSDFDSFIIKAADGCAVSIELIQ